MGKRSATSTRGHLNLTGGATAVRHITDVTNASRTMLMDLRTLDWDDDLLKIFNIPRQCSVHPLLVRRHALRSDPPKRTGGGEVPVSGDLGDSRRDRGTGLRETGGRRHLRDRQLHAAQYG